MPSLRLTRDFQSTDARSLLCPAADGCGDRAALSASVRVVCTFGGWGGACACGAVRGCCVSAPCLMSAPYALSTVRLRRAGGSCLVVRHGACGDAGLIDFGHPRDAVAAGLAPHVGSGAPPLVCHGHGAECCLACRENARPSGSVVASTACAKIDPLRSNCRSCSLRGSGLGCGGAGGKVSTEDLHPTAISESNEELDDIRDSREAAVWDFPAGFVQRIRAGPSAV